MTLIRDLTADFRMPDGLQAGLFEDGGGFIVAWGGGFILATRGEMWTNENIADDVSVRDSQGHARGATPAC